MQILSVLLVFCFSLAVHGLSSRVVGGNDAPVGKYPYQVSIRYYNSHLCGGSIINKRYILTAGHCLKSLEHVHRISVHASTNFLNVTGDVYKVESFKYHDGYSRLLLANDIGVLRVAEDIEFTNLVQPVELATTDSTFEGQSSLVAGWGFTKVDGKSSNILKELHVSIESWKMCKRAYVWMRGSQICTYQKHGEGVCQGDSGGPLVADGVQIGIVSFSLPCALGYPDVYTKVADFEDWIKQHTHKE